MEQRAVGRSGLVVSRLGLGTATWGRDTDEDDAAAQLTAFADAGGTLLDVAPGYVCEATELVVGRLLRDVVPRAEVVVAAKAGGRSAPGAMGRGGSRAPASGAASPSATMAASHLIGSSTPARPS